MKQSRAGAEKFSFKNVTWQNDDVEELVKNINSKKGCVCVVSHIGNAQMMRALASMNEAGTENKIAITSVMDTKVTGGFVKLIERINGESGFHIVGADDFGPETIFLLQQRLEQGEIVVIAGDRIGAHSDRYIELPFFRKKSKVPLWSVFACFFVELSDIFYFWNEAQRFKHDSFLRYVCSKKQCRF